MRVNSPVCQLLCYQLPAVINVIRVTVNATRTDEYVSGAAEEDGG